VSVSLSIYKAVTDEPAHFYAVVTLAAQKKTPSDPAER